MIYFLYGPDSYRSKQKLEDIVKSYKKVHKSGLNLVYVDAKEKDFKDFYSNFQIISMFDEKKLIVLKNIFNNSDFQEDFIKSIKALEEKKDIIVIFEEDACDQRKKFFKELQKHAKCQQFNFLQPATLRKWALCEIEDNKAKINQDALDLLLLSAGNDLWQLSNEIKKLSDYKKDSIIEKKDVDLLVRPNIENDIFKTINALASKDKQGALRLLKKHLDNGDNVLYLLSMIAFQFKNLLIIKQLIEKRNQYYEVVTKSGLHPFVVKKSYYLCDQFSLEKLKEIYNKIFQIDLDIKTGKIEGETALELLAVII